MTARPDAAEMDTSDYGPPRLRARRTYLEMSGPQELRQAGPPAFAVDIHREDLSPASYRALYCGVGDAYHWTDRAAWTDDEIATHLARPAIRVWVARVTQQPAGYFELRSCDDGSVEIAYFGLLPAYIGRGVGKYLLTRAVVEAWALGATRVWLHTSSLDHPSALANYLRRGFRITRTEEYETR
jgi:ribosomal protein S18 acetylase RimI-like enzyme